MATATTTYAVTHSGTHMARHMASLLSADDSPVPAYTGCRTAAQTDIPYSNWVLTSSGTHMAWTEWALHQGRIACSNSSGLAMRRVTGVSLKGVRV